MKGHGRLVRVGRRQRIAIGEVSLDQGAVGVERAGTVGIHGPAAEGVARAGDAGRGGQAEGAAVGGDDARGHAGHAVGASVEGHQVGVGLEDRRVHLGDGPEAVRGHGRDKGGGTAADLLARRGVDPLDEVVALVRGGGDFGRHARHATQRLTPASQALVGTVREAALALDAIGDGALELLPLRLQHDEGH